MTKNRFEVKGSKIIDNNGVSWDLKTDDGRYYFVKEINRLNRLYKEYFKKYHSLKRVEHYVKYLKEELDKYEAD